MLRLHSMVMTVTYFQPEFIHCFHYDSSMLNSAYFSAAGRRYGIFHVFNSYSTFSKIVKILINTVRSYVLPAGFNMCGV